MGVFGSPAAPYRLEYPWQLGLEVLILGGAESPYISLTARYLLPGLLLSPPKIRYCSTYLAKREAPILYLPARFAHIEYRINDRYVLSL